MRVEPGDLFGAALVSDDFDGDGAADLTIGVPGKDLDGEQNTGIVQLLYARPFWLGNPSSSKTRGGSGVG